MRKLAELSIVNRAVITLLCLVVLGAGLYATTQLKQELFPDLTMPGGSITASYPGATGESVESEVTEPLESALRGVPGITTVTSVSQTNLSAITVEWEYGRNSTDMESQIRQAVARTQAQLPEDVDPVVTVGSFNDLPVLVLSASSDHADPAELADRLNQYAVPALEDVPGVRSVQVSGERPKQIEITAHPDQVRDRGVDLTQLREVFTGELNPVPAGDLSRGADRVNVAVGDRLASAEDVAAIELQTTDGPVRLGDIADVRLIDAPATTFSRVNGRDALSLVVLKTPDANTVQVANAVTAALPGIAADVGQNTRFDDVFNQAPFIEDSIDNLATDGVLGLVMAVAVILVFLWSGRSTVITAVSIPLSLLMAVVALFVTDQTLNLLTLSALTISVGRVVDDSIVVIENINRHRGLVPLRDFGPPVITRAVGEVGTAVASSTLVTVAVFAPIALISGQTGELFRPFALTVTVALLASLLVALVVVPVFAYWFLRPTTKELAAEAERGAAARRAAPGGATAVAADDDPDAADHPADDHDIATQQAERPTRLQRAYLPALRWSLRHRLVTLAIAVAIFVGTMAMTPLLKTEFLGGAGENSVSVQQTLPQGATLDRANTEAQRVEAALARDPDVETYQVSVGGGMAAFGGGGDNSVSYALTLREGADPGPVSDRVRATLEQNPDAGTFTISTGASTTGSQNISVEVTGVDADDLRTATERLTDKMAGIDGLADVHSDLSVSETLLRVDVDKQAAAEQGMSQASIGMAVNDAVQGTTLGEVQTDSGITEVLLRSRPPITDRDQLADLPLPVTQRQTQKAREALTDEAKAKQDALSEEQKTQSEQDMADQEQQLRDNRDEVQQQLNEARAQLADARQLAAQAPPVPPPGAGGPGVGGMGAGGMGAGGMGADPGAQVDQLEESVTQLEEQLTGIRDQMDAMDEQRRRADEQEAQTQEIQDLNERAQDVLGDPIPLSDVAEVTEDTTPASISRTNGSRSITITGTPTGDDLGAVNAAVQQAIADTDLPPGVKASIGGVTADQDQAFNQLYLAMGVAVAIVYVIIVATFRSVLQPLLLMVSVPFAATGAIGILLVTDTALGLPAMIGMLMLIGIVVTNAIVLIDLINTYRRGGSGLDDAVVHGARLRLRPIIMTALATIMGLAPMASGLTGQSIFISQSLAIVVIGGLVSSTLLTLILVPVLYHLLESRIEKVNRRRGERRAAALGEDDDAGGLADVGLADAP